jgi:hypothetical protein
MIEKNGKITASVGKVLENDIFSFLTIESNCLYLEIVFN